MDSARSLDKLTIKYPNLVDAVTAVTQLKLTLGHNAVIDINSTTLTASRDAIDRAMTAALDKPAATTYKTPTDRYTRRVEMTADHQIALAQIQATFLLNYSQALGDSKAEQQAWAVRRGAIASLRNQIIMPTLAIDIPSGLTIIYGAHKTSLPNVICLARPDGIPREVEALIHMSHAKSPEELHLREKGIYARTIYKYFVPDLDEALWSVQEEPRGKLDAAGLRSVVMGMY